MKKTILALLVACSFVNAPAFAAFNGPETNSINTVASANEAANDSFVILTGNIVESLGNETYLFKDDTGSIQIEIDDEDWMGVDVTPTDRVVIRGEVDSEWTTPSIDVDSVKKI
ncbi:YgiW/YdeI family stress tolerance OB fold protein [Vibrio panuliri]|uniref:Uncharacterized protein n=1 Tax=Vibrio panuliri TaxID=1381081 RepID=A0A1Q9HN01_9VIBR|nr:NirD/YgiW/YdeI family stress tolerance protein [Vibrio panuliri]KAB1457228.1 NirD/YgiW/YdeI family stress tolerance protein [Vibrio panuliri]OLQ92113.1 hypothetical protein BIY22_16520 [Vibrio panuliri]OLQ92522.1 hypothetical protein BIY20_08570 [Vibrio panuliri]